LHRNLHFSNTSTREAVSLLISDAFIKPYTLLIPAPERRIFTFK
jgi:hypothetical protein